MIRPHQHGTPKEHYEHSSIARPPDDVSIRRSLHRTAVYVSRRAWLLAVAHAILFAAILWFAFCVRFDFNLSALRYSELRVILPWVMAIKLAVFAVSGQFHGWWRFVTFSDLVALGRACALCFAALAVGNFFFFATTIGSPRSIILLDTLFTLVVLGSLRSTWRLFRECVRPAMWKSEFSPALLIGADHQAATLVSQIHSYGQHPYRVRGLVSTNGEFQERRVGWLPILGQIDDVQRIAAENGVTDVLVTAGSLPGNSMRRLMNDCASAALNLKIIPPPEQRFDGSSKIPVRDIKIDDLLRRDSVQLDNEAIGRLLGGRRVLVTGAGGSIGAEICRQVVRFAPDSVVLLGRGENRIFSIEHELADEFGGQFELHPVIADIRDQDRLRQLFNKYRPEILFHTAAHKHVPLMEANAAEAVHNNVIGTRRLADAANEAGVDCFVMISTDKAVRPTSVMGATKQLCERYVQALSEASTTRFSTVRFGNVLGSAGSVVPIFQEQIRRGGPITITDSRMIRYFMTIPEASQLVLQAAALGRSGEIFALDMGTPVRIEELARDMIQLSGLPAESIEIVHTGIRPGEKLFEELTLDDSQTLPTEHPKVCSVYQPPYRLDEVAQQIDELADLVRTAELAIPSKLEEFVDDYRRETSAEQPELQPAESA